MSSLHRLLLSSGGGRAQPRVHHTDRADAHSRISGETASLDLPIGPCDQQVYISKQNGRIKALE